MRPSRHALLVVALTAACTRGAPAKPDAPPSIDATPPDAYVEVVNGDDGTPVRQACTNHFGSALNEEYGRLDGTLVSIVQPGAHGCNGDDNHVHLQILALGSIYDVAVNVGDEDGSDDVHTGTVELALPAYEEGWHTVGVLNDYADDGVHSTDLPLEDLQTITGEINADLVGVNHISVFATGYGSDGAHLVHREGGGHDGMLVTQPLASPSHARLFSFTDQAY